LSYTFRPNVLSSLSIINSITNICGFIYSGLGIGVGILVGATLGAGKIEEAKQNQKYLFKLGITVSIIMGLLMITLSPFIPLIFKEVAIDQQRLAAELIRIYAAFLFIFAICFTNYSTLRVGGQGLLAFLLDGGFMWFVAVTGSLLLAKYTTVSVIYLYLFVQFADLLKALTGIPIIKKGKWAQNLTTEFSVTNELKEEISIGL
jgi:Na+-driven multidrug efflux pump